MQCNIDKKEIRQTMLSLRKNISKEVLRDNSEMILEHFIDLGLSFDNVMCYLSFGKEVDTAPFISYFKICDKNVSVPVCDGLDMFAAEFNDLDSFKITKLGVMEPEKPIKIDKKSIEICIIPGVAFDVFGNRVGYGQGYYDRFLNDENIIKVAICHDFQLIDRKIASEKNDIKMNYIITEKRTIKICKLELI